MKVAYFIFIGVVVVGTIWLLDYATSDALAWLATDELGRPLSDARRVIAVYAPFALGMALMLLAATRVISSAKPDNRRRAWAYVLPVSLIGIAALGAAAFRANTRLAHSDFPPNELPIATSAAFDEEQWQFAETYVRRYYRPL